MPPPDAPAKRLGRPPTTLCGLTAEGWARALGDPSDARVRRARNIVSGRAAPSPAELVAVSAATEVAVAELVAELARRAK